jgi:outer membrane protein assembly factor BamB
MATFKRIYIMLILALLLIPCVASLSTLQPNSIPPVNAQVNPAATSNSGTLNQYEWPEFQGDSAFSRFSAGPAPSTSNVLWKANITGILPYIVAFDGLIFVCNNTSVFAVDQTGHIAWEKTVSMTGTWPIVYKIDNSHLVVENNCLDPKTGNTLWTSNDFTADTAPLFVANVYSPEEKMFYTKVESYIEGWSFSNPSVPPTMSWKTYVLGGGSTGSGVTYGGGAVFPGSFMSQQIALNASNGNVMWDTSTKGPMIFSGSYYEGRFLRGGTDDNTLYCFNASNGDILWTYTPDTNGYFTVGTAVAYGMVYALNKDGVLYAINVATGNLAWQYKGPGPLMFPGNPTVADGKVYATTGQDASYNGEVGASQFACLDAFSGQVIWALDMEALAPKESVAIAYGNLYIIPGDVTTAVDTISGNEYTTNNQLWAMGTQSTAVSDWPMWRADPSHASTAPSGPTNLTLAWKYTTSGAVISSPTIADGILYVGSQDKNIYALGAWSGTLIWKFETQGAIESSPAVANGRVYTGGDDGYVYCLDASTGAFIWKTFVNGNLPFTFATIVLKSSPAVVGGVVYVGSLDGYMYALDANYGNIIWKTPTEGPIESSPAVVDGAVYFTSQEPTKGAVYKLDAGTGAVVWKHQIQYEFQFIGGTEMLGSPSVADGMVFASSNVRAYYGLNAQTGDEIWKFGDESASEFICSSPIYVNGQLFVIDKFNLACLNATTSQVIWSYYTGDELYTSPSYADGKVYMATSQRDIFILDAANGGSKLATAITPSSSWSSPTIANGRLYIGNNDWNIYCYQNILTNEPSTQAKPQNPILASNLLLSIIAIAAVAVIVVVGYAVRRRTKK